MDYQTHEHDVIVIGAGGAGLRAAIEASASGVSVGLVCKSLLGKAHTVMAEGGIAAALANVDDRDNWKVHFADTMRGGQYVNNWRMAQLHAQEAPARVRELEAWGAVFDRTQGRQDPPAELRRPQVSAPGPRRRPHRPRTDPHAAGSRHPPGHLSLHGADGHPAPQGRRPHRRGARLRPRTRPVDRLQGEGDHARDRRHRQGVQDHVELVGIHRRRPHARLRRRGRTDRHGVRPVPPDRHGLAAERPRHPRHRGRARRGRRAAEQQGRAVHVRRHPGQLQAADREGRRGRVPLRARRQGTPTGRRNC